VPPSDTIRPPAGYTPSELAVRWRISREKVLGWIHNGQLAAINTSRTMCGKPRFLVTPEALARFEANRQAVTPPKACPRRRKPRAIIDFYPD
jgi:hypothetical protein